MVLGEMGINHFNISQSYRNVPGNPNDINSLYIWATSWAITYNATKTVHMVISWRRQPSIIHCNMNNVPINVVKTHKQLGLTFNDNATWDDHINTIIPHANRRLGVLQNLKYKANKQTLLILYKPFVRSKLEYADVVWDSLPQTLDNKLEKVQIQAMRAITGLTISAHKQDIYRETGLLPLANIRNFHRLVMFYKIMNGLAPHYLRELIPEHAYQRHNYNTRNAEERIIPYICRTASLTRSFIPQTIKDLNSLDAIIREKPTLSSFKNALLKIPELRQKDPLIVLT
jgi:hypothetical protein